MGRKAAETGYIVIYSDRHESYDLFRDLKRREDVQLVVTRPKKVGNGIMKAVRKVHLSGTIANHIRLPLKSAWYERPDIHIDEGVRYYLIVVDMALSSISSHYLKSITDRPNVKSILLMINSVRSNTIRQVRRDMDSIKWDAILTFDDKDAETYGYEKVGYCYYSKHDAKMLEERYHKAQSDAYFIGTMKSSRKKEIISVYEALRNSGLKTEFHLLRLARDMMEDVPYKDEIDYFTSDRGLIPYDEILASVINTKVIVEIVQEGQAGPSLRYYEAVCYNKKLLTNNPSIVDFPFYDGRFMRVFGNPEDIESEWLREECEVEYHYNGEFSPVRLLDKITEL